MFGLLKLGKVMLAGKPVCGEILEALLYLAILLVCMAIFH